MTARRTSDGFASRPRDAESWVKAPDRAAGAAPPGDLYTARLTVDITPALRGRIKIAAFRGGETAADVASARCSRANSPTPMEASHEV
jgi:hypothetical protein